MTFPSATSEPLAIDTSTTALVVIDLQKGITSMPAAPHTADDVIANAAKLARACRAHQLPVVLVCVTLSADGKDALQPIADNRLQMKLPRPADWAEFVPELTPEPGDLIITKRQWGAFHGTELDLQLRRRKVETIILCGISTNAGVESTARFAYEYGYQQIFAEDACSARSTEDHVHTMKSIFARLGRVRKTAEILAALK